MLIAQNCISVFLSNRSEEMEELNQFFADKLKLGIGAIEVLLMLIQNFLKVLPRNQFMALASWHIQLCQWKCDFLRIFEVPFLSSV